MAAERKMGKVLELVEAGQASLHDRDERGWSLLHVSTARWSWLVVLNLAAADILVRLV